MARVKPTRSAGATRARSKTPTVPRAPRHAHAAAATRPVVCAIVTASDTRGRLDDPSGDAIADRVRRAGHEVGERVWVRDDVVAIRRAVRVAIGRRAVDVVLVTGGTGIGARDVTPEALSSLLDRTLPGFGERFRALSEAQVGSAAWLSRAFAGTARGRLVVALPGSTRAVTLALDRLVIPELGHAIRLLGRL